MQILAKKELTPTGFELPQDFPGNPQEPSEGGAKTSAVSADSSSIDPDLARVNAAWPALPAPIRAAILALVQHTDTK
jgi:hypothetical protein